MARYQQQSKSSQYIVWLLTSILNTVLGTDKIIIMIKSVCYIKKKNLFPLALKQIHWSVKTVTIDLDASEMLWLKAEVSQLQCTVE